MREGWTYKKLGEVAKVIMGQSPDGNSLNSSNGIEFHQGKVFFGEKYLNVSNSFTEQPSKIAEPNSVLLCVRAPVGIVNITQRRICIGRGLCAIQPNDIIIMPFIFYALTQKQAYFDKNSTGSTFKAISSKVVLNTEIPTPPLSEQERIVSELDLLSSVIKKKKAQLQEYDQLAKSIFYDMFGDPITNEKGWEVKKLGEVCEVTSSKRIFANEYTSSGIPFYRGKEITEKSKGMPLSIELYISEEMYKELKLIGIPQIGDVLITAVGTIGNIWVVNDNTPFYFKDGNVIWLKNIRMQNSVYFKFILEKLIEIYKQEMVRGAAYNALTIVNLKKMLVFLPPLTLQQQFAEKIEAIEKQKELIKQSITEAENLFSSRMDYYFN